MDGRFVGPSHLAVAAALGRQIDDNRTGLHRVHHLRGDQNRRPLARDQCGGDHHIAVRDDFDHHFTLTAIEGFILRFRIAPFVFRVRRFERKLDELCPQALDLFLDGRPDVIGLDLGAQAAR